jgi:hypothetical protein
MDSRPRSYDIPCVTIITLSSPRPWKPFDDRLGHRHLLSRHSDRVFNGRRKARGSKKKGSVRPCDCHSARQSRRGHVDSFGSPGAASAAHLHESASAGLWMGVSTPKQPEAVDSSQTFVTWSKRNSTATLFMASLWKMLAKIRDHARQSSNVSAVEEARSQYERARGHPA